jgi:hypothetical protein
MNVNFGDHVTFLFLFYDNQLRSLDVHRWTDVMRVAATKVHRPCLTNLSPDLKMWHDSKESTTVLTCLDSYRDARLGPAEKDGKVRPMPCNSPTYHTTQCHQCREFSVIHIPFRHLPYTSTSSSFTPQNFCLSVIE